MLTNLQILLKEITDLERGLRRNEDREGLKKIQGIKKRIKIMIAQEMQK